MQMSTLITGPIGVNTYIVYGRNEGECFVIDPSSTKKIVPELERLSLRPTHVLLTHGHFDHILSVADLQEKYGARVCIHKDDTPCLSDEGHNLGNPVLKIRHCTPDVEFTGGETLSCAGFEIRTIHTPGHSKGSSCYLLEDERVLFTGDTLFKLSVGRTDLAYSDPHELRESLQNGILTLEGDYEVYPGHMEKTTLEYERKRNPYINRWSPDTW